MAYLIENNLIGILVESHLRSYNIKSGYGESIYSANTLFGYILIHYTKNYRALTEDDFEFLETITNQAGIAFHQVKLYKTIQKQAEREKIYRPVESGSEFLSSIN